MALIGNNSSLNKSAGKFISGAGHAQLKGNFYNNGAMKSADSAFGEYSSRPAGYGGGYAYKLAEKTGGISSFTKSYSESVLNFNLAGGRNLEAVEAGILTTNNPILDRIISFIASSSGTISTDATINAALLLQANASGLISSDVLLGAIFSVTATTSGQASNNAFLTALANIIAEVGGPEPLSPQGLANAVWNKQLSSLNAGDLQLLLESLSVKLDELHKLNGLDSTNPVTVTQTTRNVATISQEFSGNGLDTTIITRV